MNGDLIRVALHDKDLSFNILAEAIGVSTKLVHCVAHRKTTSQRVAKAIALALNKPITEVFPDKPAYSAPAAVEPRRSRVDALREKLQRVKD